MNSQLIYLNGALTPFLPINLIFFRTPFIRASPLSSATFDEIFFHIRVNELRFLALYFLLEYFPLHKAQYFPIDLAWGTLGAFSFH